MKTLAASRRITNTSSLHHYCTLYCAGMWDFVKINFAKRINKQKKTIQVLVPPVWMRVTRKQRSIFSFTTRASMETLYAANRHLRFYIRSEPVGPLAVQPSFFIFFSRFGSQELQVTSARGGILGHDFVAHELLEVTLAASLDAVTA